MASLFKMIVSCGWFLITIVLTVFQPTLSQENPEISKLEKFYYDKCLKYTGNLETFNKLRNDVYELNEYFKYAFKFLPKQKKTFCESQRSNLKDRAKEIEGDLNACLPSQEKFLGKFFRRTFEEFLHFFCHNDGEYTRRFFSSETSQCIKAVEDSKTNDLENCLNRIFSPSKGYVTQSEMCDDITVTRKCFTQLLEVYCTRSYDVKGLNGVFFDYIAKPCSSSVSVISSSILIVLALFYPYLLIFH